MCSHAASQLPPSNDLYDRLPSPWKLPQLIPVRIFPDLRRYIPKLATLTGDLHYLPAMDELAYPLWRIDGEEVARFELCRPGYDCAVTSIGAAHLLVVPPVPKRWLPARKAQIVDAVRRGLITLEEALERYNISMGEFLSWQHNVNLHGVAGLRANGVHRRQRVRIRWAACSPVAKLSGATVRKRKRAADTSIASTLTAEGICLPALHATTKSE